MDLGSVEKATRHIYDARRVSSELIELSPEQIESTYEQKRELAASRWEACFKSYVMLFMMLNRGNRWPKDDFEICVAKEEIKGATYRTCIQVWRDRKTQRYSAKPFVDCGHGIVDNKLPPEHFDNEFTYNFGTHYAKSAKFEASFDAGVKSDIMMTRLDGKQVDEMTDSNKAIMIAAIDGAILPHLDNIEDTLFMLNDALLNEKLNPELAQKARLQQPTP